MICHRVKHILRVFVLGVLVLSNSCQQSNDQTPAIRISDFKDESFNLYSNDKKLLFCIYNGYMDSLTGVVYYSIYFNNCIPIEESKMILHYHFPFYPYDRVECMIDIIDFIPFKNGNLGIMSCNLSTNSSISCLESTFIHKQCTYCDGFMEIECTFNNIDLNNFYAKRNYLITDLIVGDDYFNFSYGRIVTVESEGIDTYVFKDNYEEYISFSYSEDGLGERISLL